MISEYDFLEDVSKYVKYAGIHKDIKSELASHIEETKEYYAGNGLSDDEAYEKAVADMGSAESIGKAFNQQYRMPFNSRNGLIVWSSLMTAFIYFIMYPLLIRLSHAADISNRNMLILSVILLTALINYIYLKKSHFKLSGRDVRDVCIGFLGGAIVSVSVLFLLSSMGRYGYYPYMDNVHILFLNPVTYFGSEVRLCGDEFLILALLILIYSFSCKVNSKNRGFAFAIYLDSIYPRYIDIDEHQRVTLNMENKGKEN